MHIIDIDKIKRSDADPKVVEVYRELKRFREAEERREWIQRDKDAESAVVKNKMWELEMSEDDLKEMKKTGQVPIVINKCRKGVQGNSAVITANNPEIKALPKRESDPYVAELLKWGLDFVWDKNDGKDMLWDAVERRNLGGHAVIYAKQDESKGMFGRVVIQNDDPTDWHWDAKSRKRDMSDTHLIKAKLRSKKWIKDHYDGITDEDLIFEAVDDTQDTSSEKVDTVTGADNYAIDADKSDPTVPTDKDARNIWEIEAYMLRVEKEDWAVFMRQGDDSPTVAKLKLKPKQKPEDVIKDYVEREDGDFIMAKHWPRRVANRYLIMIVGKKIIKQTDDNKEEVDELLNPYGVDSDGDPVLPCIPLTSQRSTSSSYCYAPTFYAIPINQSLNKREAQFIFAVSKTLNAPIARDEGSRWSGQADRPGSEIIVSKHAAFQPFRLSPGTVDLSGLAMRIEEDKSNIDDQYDLPEVMRGKIPKGQENMSGRLGIALQDTASMMQNPAVRGTESALVRLAKVELAIMLKVWPRYMWERLLPEHERADKYPDGIEPPDSQGNEELEKTEQDNNIKKWEAALDKIVNDGIKLVDLDIRLTAGSSLPTNRMAKEQIAMEKFKVGLYDRQAALEYSNEPKAKEIAERMDKKEAEAAQAGMLK